MRAFFDDVRLALRQHLRQPGYAVIVASTLGLSIGATTAVFSVVNTVLFRALPFESPQNLMWIASVRSDNRNAPFSLPEYLDYRTQVRSLSGLAAYATWSASLAGEEAAERLTGARMSANAFEVLAVSASAGRLLTASDDAAAAPQVVVLSYRLWQRRYGGRMEVIGTTARINGEPFAIVGVLPVHFPLPLLDVDLVTPLAPDRDPLRDQRNSVNFLRFLGRLEPGVSPAQAQADLTTIGHTLRQQFPVEYARKESVGVVPLHETLVGDRRQALLLLFAAVFVVLATALANLVSLALVKVSNRRARFTVQIALGASRGTLFRQLAAESLVLAGTGSVVGWLLVLQMVSLAKRWAPRSMPRLEELTIDGTVVLFAVAMTVAVTALLTAAPFAALARAEPGDTLKSGGRGSIGDRQNRRAQNVLVIGEIAAALVLVFVALVLVDNVIRLSTVHPGFTPEGVFQARVSLPSRYQAPEDVTRFYERLSDRLAAAPGVRAVGVVSVAPLSGLLRTIPFSEAGQAVSPRDRAMANLRVITPGYMTAVGIRLLHGRVITDADRLETPPVALVSTALADRFLGGSGVGHQLLINDNNKGPRPVEVVGIVENVRQTALDAGPELDIYLAWPQLHPDNVALLRNNQFWMIRTASNPAGFAATFLAHLRAVDPDAAVSEPGSMRRLVDDWLRPRRFNLGLLGSFALTAVLLAVLGLYGLISYSVSQRKRELGMRLALGATGAAIQRMVLLQAARLGVAGASVSLLVAAAIRPLLESTLQSVDVNPLFVSLAASVLASLVLVAAWLPARRAARVDPMVALRCE